MKKLLSLMDKGQALSQHELAEMLNISTETLGAQIEYLERMGLLRRVFNNCECGGGCKGCSSKCHDSGISLPVMWEKVI